MNKLSTNGLKDKLKRKINRFRLKWLTATKGLNYSVDAIEAMYRIYLNHSKVIHYRDGCPVYSLSTPALYTGPSANFFARQFYKNVHGKNTPNLMSFAVTGECNAACSHCSFYSDDENTFKEPVTRSEASSIIKAAQDIGVSIINFTGGEPLMRKDLPDILRSVDKERSTTILFTNGWYLSSRAKTLKKSGLDSVYVSIDAPISEEHDRRRGLEGLFNKAIKGIKSSLRAGLSTGISCCITPEGFKKGELFEIIELAKKLGVHEVIVYDATPTGRLNNRDDLKENHLFLEEMIQSVESYNKDLSYPGVMIYAYTTSHRGVGCSSGVNYFYVSPYGEVCPCDFNHMVFGNAVTEPLYRIWDRMTSLPDFNCTKWGYCRLKAAESENSPVISREFREYDSPEA